MALKLDTSKLKWEAADADGAADKLRPHPLVAIRVKKVPTSESGRKTLGHHCAKDRLNPHSGELKSVKVKRRGGRDWRHTKSGTALPNLAPGQTYVVPKDPNLLASLKSIGRFIEVAGVSK